jgi:hypothetical protein
VHPLKLATDIGVTPPSLFLLWSHELLAGLIVAFVPAMVVSAVLLRTTDLTSYRDRPIGAYLRRFMTPLVQVLRLVGFVVCAIGAWVREPAIIVAGLALVAACWSYGLLISTLNDARQR